MSGLTPEQIQEGRNLAAQIESFWAYANGKGEPMPEGFDYSMVVYRFEQFLRHNADALLAAAESVGKLEADLVIARTDMARFSQRTEEESLSQQAEIESLRAQLAAREQEVTVPAAFCADIANMPSTPPYRQFYLRTGWDKGRQAVIECATCCGIWPHHTDECATLAMANLTKHGQRLAAAEAEVERLKAIEARAGDIAAWLPNLAATLTTVPVPVIKQNIERMQRQLQAAPAPSVPPQTTETRG